MSHEVKVEIFRLLGMIDYFYINDPETYEQLYKQSLLVEKLLQQE